MNNPTLLIQERWWETKIRSICFQALMNGSSHSDGMWKLKSKNRYKMRLMRCNLTLSDEYQISLSSCWVLHITTNSSWVLQSEIQELNEILLTIKNHKRSEMLWICKIKILFRIKNKMKKIFLRILAVILAMICAAIIDWILFFIRIVYIY